MFLQFLVGTLFTLFTLEVWSIKRSVLKCRNTWSLNNTAVSVPFLLSLFLRHGRKGAGIGKKVDNRSFVFREIMWPKQCRGWQGRDGRSKFSSSHLTIPLTYNLTIPLKGRPQVKNPETGNTWPLWLGSNGVEWVFQTMKNNDNKWEAMKAMKNYEKQWKNNKK